MKLIGVTNTSFDQDFIRNQLFLFDELLVLTMERAISLGGDFDEARHRTHAELAFLKSQGVVKHIWPIQYSPERELPDYVIERFNKFSKYSETWQAFNNSVIESESLWQRFDFGFCKTEEEAISTINRSIALQLRAHSILANLAEQTEFAFCSDDGLGVSKEQGFSPDSHVVSIILDQIPIIPDMPYDEVLDFRQDPVAKRLHNRLMAWVVRSSTFDQDPKLINLEIEEAIVEYREFTSRQTKRQKLLQIEMILKLPLDVIESLLKLSPSKGIASIIDIRRRKIDLYEAELKGPGNQFAYLREIEKHFPPYRWS